jgi:hypothetical protein
MGINLSDIAAQRAMIERGEEKRKADWKLAERERLRDTFAAAALTGLLAGPGDKDFSADYWARHAYEAADAMLRERGRVTEPMTENKRAEVVLTDEDRDAIEWCIFQQTTPQKQAVTLRKLLERLK